MVSYGRTAEIYCDSERVDVCKRNAYVPNTMPIFISTKICDDQNDDEDHTRDGDFEIFEIRLAKRRFWRVEFVVFSRENFADHHTKG